MAVLRIEPLLDRHVFHADADGGPSFGQPPRDEELVVAEATVRGFRGLLRRAELARRVREEGGVRARRVPDAGELPARITAASRVAGDVDLGLLVGKRVVELAAQQHAEIAWIDLERELRGAGRVSPTVGVSRVDLPSFA